MSKLIRFVKVDDMMFVGEDDTPTYGPQVTVSSNDPEATKAAEKANKLVRGKFMGPMGPMGPMAASLPIILQNPRVVVINQEKAETYLAPLIGNPTAIELTNIDFTYFNEDDAFEKFYYGELERKSDPTHPSLSIVK